MGIARSASGIDQQTQKIDPLASYSGFVSTQITGIVPPPQRDPVMRIKTYIGDFHQFFLLSSISSISQEAMSSSLRTHPVFSLQR